MQILPVRPLLPGCAPRAPRAPARVGSRRAPDMLRRLERATRALDAFHDAFPAASLAAGQDARVRLWVRHGDLGDLHDGRG